MNPIAPLTFPPRRFAFRCRSCALELERTAPIPDAVTVESASGPNTPLCAIPRPPTCCPGCRTINSFVLLPEGHVVRASPDLASTFGRPGSGGPSFFDPRGNSRALQGRPDPRSPWTATKGPLHPASLRRGAEIVDPTQRVRVPYIRSSTGISGVDHVTGGGLARGYVLMVAGAPGCGKSTLLTQVASSVQVLGTHFGCGVAYGSAEEDEEAVIETADRVAKANFKIVLSNSLQELLEALDATGAVVWIIDSLMTVASDKLLTEPGSPSQVNACATMLEERSHATGIFKGKEKRSILVVAHGTKDGDLAGPMKALHAVDGAVLVEHVDPVGDILAGRPPWSLAPDQTRPTGYVSARTFRKMRKASNRRIVYFYVQPEYLDVAMTQKNPVGGRLDRVQGPPIIEGTRAGPMDIDKMDPAFLPIP